MTRTKFRDLVGKFLALLLAISVTLFACGPFRGARADSDAVEIWSTYATEKIMQNEYARYEAVRFAPNVSVNACKGEYESTQLILTAKQDISNYNVQAFDLSDGAGNTFEAENILVYHEKYIEISNVYEGNGASAGMYPDALLPMDKAAEFGENKIAVGTIRAFTSPSTSPSGRRRAPIRVR